LDIFARIAERLIREAMENGEFDNLEGAGKPLNFADETWIPEDLRIAYRVLKNAGYIPPEIELRNEIINMSSLINTIDDDKERLKKIKELNFILLKLNTMRKSPFDLDNFPEYERKVVDKLTGGL
jgi:hypothetical protein